ncbi:SMP-30/gluconolactonase/LRE family protein [Dyadobacter sp. CY347]|uniref:SMP-30/gluconolactonase/LRE family protein n=1 Tax=Dyadobacter sp. CY347 TaxID=2909336 RepID=UPI001F25E0DF|nr:SMP-30/gluconolactonase/LRE family protein [Dyadobacter sp. CY347]MCF2487930.1 SMP-30/gluconolactonase/LRE family protein [Dyadobacter sp. CY347]
MKLCAPFLYSFLLLSHIGFAQKSYPTMGKIIYEDPAFEKLLAKDAKIEVLASGFEWSEGPVWVKDSSFLLFSDVPKNKVYKWDEKGGLSVFLEPSGYTGRGVYSDEPGSNGLIIDSKGRLVSCEHGDRRISALSLKIGGKVTLADHFDGNRFNSPNDVTEHANGSYYFTDPPYGLAKKHEDPSRETKQFGVYRIANDGKVSLQIPDLTRPNGLAFSPDRKILYIAQSDPEKAVIMAYNVDDSGNVTGKGKLIYDATPMVKAGKPGLPDGLKIDKDGNLWSSGPGGMLIITPAGKLIGRIEMGELTSNCAWGNDGATLYMTVDGYICRVKTNTKGAGW